MRNDRRNRLILSALVGVVGLLIWFFWPHKTDFSKVPVFPDGSNKIAPNLPSSIATSVPRAAIAPPTEAEVKHEQEQQMTMSYLTPISIYGKVVDKSGSPIPGATVRIGVADKPLVTGSEYREMTDEGGLFSLRGVHGIAFNLAASKHGYYTTEQSMGQRNVIVPSDQDFAQSSQGDPIILVLRKQGHPIPLILVRSGQIDVPKTWKNVNVDLADRRSRQGLLQVASWVGDASQHPFDWRYQLSVPGGGLVERKGQFDFQAPTEGFQSTEEVNMPVTSQKWTSSATKDYFAMLPDGRYARFSINIYPGQRNFVVIESYVNPTPGDRNLEPVSN